MHSYAIYLTLVRMINWILISKSFIMKKQRKRQKRLKCILKCFYLI